MLRFILRIICNKTASNHFEMSMDTFYFLTYFHASFQIFPFIYVFMVSRCTSSYKQVFTYIENNLLNLAPEFIHSDYEASLLKAIQIMYPNAKRVGCWFHYGQAVRKRLGRNKGRNFFVNLKKKSRCIQFI